MCIGDWSIMLLFFQNVLLFVATLLIGLLLVARHEYKLAVRKGIQVYGYKIMPYFSEYRLYVNSKLALDTLKIPISDKIYNKLKADKSKMRVIYIDEQAYVYTGRGMGGTELITFSHPKPDSVKIELHGKQSTLF
jgi:hypothetical protein